ncbi:4-demethylwyosine synthase TYW1 [Candidatus Woesearchaeota archaeon]|nr:MAG: 4-demethylwyosine synthase TYW1 [Candidatus Woesearchaeota archaeon]
MISEAKKKDLEKQGYRIVGNHSAIKLCLWCKKAIRNEDTCYKNTFYGIKSHRCIQMTPSLQTCSHRCYFCWRDIDWTKAKWEGPVDSPEEIVDGCIREHIKYIQGFKGTMDTTDAKKFKEALEPLHFAISLSGEPCSYPELPKLIDEIKRRKMTAFLVTNGTIPDMIKKLAKKHEPTQLYITLPAPDEKTYKKVCSPMIRDGWLRIMESLASLKDFECNTVIRLTLVKGINMFNPAGYAAIIKKYQPVYVEAKAYVWVGHSRERLGIESMPQHQEIKSFAEDLSELSDYKIVNEKKESRVLLLKR